MNERRKIRATNFYYIHEGHESFTVCKVALMNLLCITSKLLDRLSTFLFKCKLTKDLKSENNYFLLDAKIYVG
jgi:hypothetical protein